MGRRRSGGLVVAVVAFVLAALGGRAQAHQSSYSYASIALQEDGHGVAYEIRLSSKDLYEALALGEDRDATDREILAGGQAIERYVFQRVALNVPGQDCETVPQKVQVVADGQRFARLGFRLVCAERIATVQISYELFFDLDPRHEGLLRVGEGLVQLGTDRREYTHVWGHATPASSLGFLRSGAEHVLYGLDHILFLVALLLVIGLRQDGGMLRARTARESLRNAATIVTAFTVGHSLTLILAALGWIALPSRLVESLIAASIVYVAVENVFRPDPPRRYLITLSFGLMHGLGFASMLRPLLPPQDVVIPLLVFNVGVELGQLAVVAIALPVLTLILLGLGVQGYRRVGLPTASAVLGIVGFVWLAQRALAL
jgi:hypothetical protein